MPLLFYDRDVMTHVFCLYVNKMLPIKKSMDGFFNRDSDREIFGLEPLQNKDQE